MHEGDLKGLIQKRWTEAARTYDKCPGHGIHSLQEKQAWVQILAEALEAQRSVRVLDVGTGTGALALLLAEMGHNAIGIDLSEAMLKIAQEKAQKAGLRVEFRKGDAEAPPFPQESFDAVVSRHVLWTLPNPEKAVREWRRILRPGGRVIVIDGNWSRKDRTWLQELWRVSAMPLIAITEWRDPRWKGQELDQHLPMRQRERPQADIELLKSEGFRASVTDVVLPRKYSFLSYLKYGHSRHSARQFVVKGVKP